MTESLRNMEYLVPEVIVCLTIVFLILNRFWGDAGRRPYADIAGLGLTAALFCCFTNLFEAPLQTRVLISNGVLVVDIFSQLLKCLFLLATMAAIGFSSGSVEISDKRWMEYCAFILGLCTGMMFLVSSTNLLMIYLSFEMISLCSYVLAGYIKGDPRSAEAGFKYVLFGAVSSGIMLFGLSYLYGMTGTIDVLAIGARLGAGLFPNPDNLALPVLFILVGIGYKVAFFPFHYWAPDVYEGSPTPVTAFFSVGPKAAGFALFLRVLFGIVNVDTGMSFQWLGWLLAVVAAATMTIGNMAALNQSNIKRMLAYSAIAHAGYMVMGLAALSSEAATAVLFYLFVYTFMNLGAFTIVIALFNIYQSEQVDELTGMGKLYPLAGFCMAVCLFSLTGLPPTGGFIGKFYVFAAVIGKGWYTLAFIAAVNTVLSLFYYMRILKAFYFKEPRVAPEHAPEIPVGYNLLFAGLTLPVLVLGLCWHRVVEFCAQAVTSLVL